MIGINQKSRQKHKNGIFLFFLGLYILFLYIAQEGLLSTTFSSLTLYAFLGTSFVFLLLHIRTVPLTGFTVWYVAMIMLCFISSALAPHFQWDTLYAMFVALILSFFYIMLVDDFWAIDLLANFYIWSCVAMIIALIATDQFFLEDERLGQTLSGNANTFSAMLMSSTVFCAWHMVCRCTRKNRILYIAAYVLQLVAMGLSGGRKTIVAVLACTFLFILFSSNKKRPPMARNLLIALLVVSVVFFAFLNVPFLYDSVGARFESLLGFENASVEVSSDRLRRRMIELALDGWVKSPIFGHGFNEFKYYNLETTGHFFFSHNNFVELLYDVGLVGFVLYYSMYVHLFIKLMKFPSNWRPYKMLGIGLMAQLLIFEMGDISFFSTFSIIILSVVYSITKVITRTMKSRME